MWAVAYFLKVEIYIQTTYVNLTIYFYLFEKSKLLRYISRYLTYGLYGTYA